MRSGYGLYVLVAIGTVGCDAESEHETATFQIATSPKRAAEEPLLALASRQSTFSGYYCSGGDLHVAVSVPATNVAARAVKSIVETDNTAIYCSLRDVPTHKPEVVLVERKYNFLQLRAWRDSISNDFLDMPEALSIGIDYSRNRLKAKVKTGAIAAGKAFMDSQQLPIDAYEVAEGTVAEPKSACPPSPYIGQYPWSCFRPVPGGVLIETLKPSGASWGPCTLGPAAVREGQVGWVVNAHCVKPWPGQNQYNPVFQPVNESGQTAVGMEWFDPISWSCGIPPFGRNCRHSDSAWVKLTSDIAGVGSITRNQWWNGANPCVRNSPSAACTTDLGNPRFHVRGTQSPIQGMQVEKVGQASGWSTGTIVDPCEDLNDNVDNRYICNAISTNYLAGGDSGSPVFYWYSHYGVSTVDLVGLAWGGDGGNLLLSPWSNVVQDLGSLEVRYAPVFQQMSGELGNDISVGANGHVWITTDTPYGGWGYTIKRWNGIAWVTIDGGAVRLAVDPSGNAWVVNTQGMIFRWNGTGWLQMPGSAVDIGIGANGAVWIIGTTPAAGGNTVWTWNGSGWSLVAGGGVRIAVDPAGNPWITSNNNTIWRRIGAMFQQVPGVATDIGIGGDGMVWIVGTAPVGGGNAIYWWTGFTSQTTSLNWMLVSGGATSIGVERGGRPWVTNSLKYVFRSL